MSPTFLRKRSSFLLIQGFYFAIIPCCFIQWLKLPTVVWYFLATHVLVDPFLRRASISTRCLSSLLLPTPLGRPNGFPCCLRAGRLAWSVGRSGPAQFRQQWQRPSR